jgi:hypothetical protein
MQFCNSATHVTSAPTAEVVAAQVENKEMRVGGKIQ